jgi:hypothetical protein
LWSPTTRMIGTVPTRIDPAGSGGLSAVCLTGGAAALAASPSRRSVVRRGQRDKNARAFAREFQPAVRGRAANTVCALVLAVEAVGTLLLWAPIPLAWLWIGGRVFAVTGSLAADLGAAFFGFVATTILAMMALNRIDKFWIRLRRRAGHEQTQGALPQVAVVSVTLGLVVFVVWYYALSNAFIIPFMPSQ